MVTGWLAHEGLGRHGPHMGTTQFFMRFNSVSENFDSDSTHDSPLPSKIDSHQLMTQNCFLEFDSDRLMTQMAFQILIQTNS